MHMDMDMVMVMHMHTHTACVYTHRRADEGGTVAAGGGMHAPGVSGHAVLLAEGTQLIAQPRGEALAQEG